MPRIADLTALAFGLGLIFAASGCHLLLPGSGSGSAGDAAGSADDASMSDSIGSIDLGAAEDAGDASPAIDLAIPDASTVDALVLSDSGHDGAVGPTGACVAAAVETPLRSWMSKCHPAIATAGFTQQVATGLCAAPYSICSVDEYLSYGGDGALLVGSESAWLAGCLSETMAGGSSANWKAPCSVQPITDTLFTVDVGPCPSGAGVPFPFSVDVGIATQMPCKTLNHAGTSRTGYIEPLAASNPGNAVKGVLCCRSACAGQTTIARVYDQGQMVRCVGSGGVKFSQCTASVNCAAGFHMCSPDEYIAHGGDTLAPPLGGEAWLAGCAKTNGTVHDPPLQTACGQCVTGNVPPKLFMYSCTSTTTFQVDSQPFVGVATSAASLRLINQNAPCGFWQIAPTQQSQSGVMCCVDQP